MVHSWLYYTTAVEMIKLTERQMAGEQNKLATLETQQQYITLSLLLGLRCRSLNEHPHCSKLGFATSHVLKVLFFFCQLELTVQCLLESILLRFFPLPLRVRRLLVPSTSTQKHTLPHAWLQTHTCSHGHTLSLSTHTLPTHV